MVTSTQPIIHISNSVWITSLKLGLPAFLSINLVLIIYSGSVSYFSAKRMYLASKNALIVSDTRSAFKILSASEDEFSSIAVRSDEGTLDLSVGSSNTKGFFTFSFTEPNLDFKVYFTLNFEYWAMLFIVANAITLPLIFFLLFKFNAQRKRESITKQRLEMLTALAEVSAQFAHDSRSPLTAINTVASVVNDKNIPQSKDLINAANARLNDMVSNLFIISKDALSMNQELVRNSAFNSQELKANLKSLIIEKQIEHNKKHIKIEDEVEIPDLIIPGDRDKIIRILSNLLNNSIEASTDAGAQIKIKGSYNDVNSQLELRVIDNGKGIQSFILSKIGRKLGFTTKVNTINAGNGMALYFARQYVESLDGTFQIESLERKGTTITISIPAHTKRYSSS